MGFDLKPNNEEAGSFHMGAFSFPWMLGAGVGLVIGYGKLEGASFVYDPREVTHKNEDTGETHTFATSPNCNDGYPVTAEEAMAMAHAAHGLVNVERYVRRMWDERPAEERARIEAMRFDDPRRPRMPVREDFIEKVEQFSEWVAKSGGFEIY
jgi:hypothetical protein